MSFDIGNGVLGSLRAQVAHEIHVLTRHNKAMRRARRALPQRILRLLLANRTLLGFLAIYLALDVVAVICEVLFSRFKPAWLPLWTTPDVKSLLKDIGSYLISAQVGTLAVVSVAVGIITLIAQGNDRTSNKTDIRLYYVESLAYEVALSGIALLIVLNIQLLWPFQYAAHVLGFGSGNLFFKVILTAVHVFWLCLNLSAFANFIVATLRFVEPAARERMREQYSANTIIPIDLSRRLLRALYINAPKALLPESAEKEELRILFGYTLSADGDVEIERKFRSPTVLYDVWARPLGVVLRRWRARTMRDRRRPNHRAIFLKANDPRLVLPVSFDGIYEGHTAVCSRQGSVALRSWERLVIRLSFRFRAADDEKRQLPALSDFLEELTEKITSQIEKSAISGFKSALDETVRYHRFVLDAQDTRSDGGDPLSFAEVGGFWEPPHQGWIRLYRHVLEVAANKIGTETHFIESLGYLTRRLLPDNARNLSPGVVTALLDIALHEVVMLEAWVTRRTTVEVMPGHAAQPRLGLTGSDQRAYDQVTLNFVGAWEGVAQLTDRLYDWEQAKLGSSAEYWDALAHSWPFLERHLRNTAYFLTSAVWNEDEIGAGRFRDSLVRWHDTVRLEANGRHRLRQRMLLTPDLTKLDWAQVETRLIPFRRDVLADSVEPGSVFDLIIQGALEDALILCALVCLNWHVNEQQNSDIGGRTAVLLVRRQANEAEGSRRGAPGVQPSPIFRSIISLVIREALAESLVDGRYGSAINGMIRFLSGMSERRVVPGRIYSTWGMEGLDSMRPQLLALMAAHLPDQGDEGVVDWLRSVASADELLADRDESLRRIVQTLSALVNASKDSLDQTRFDRTVHAFAPQADASASIQRLRDILVQGVEAIEHERLNRLRARAVDAVKLASLSEALSDAMMSQGPELDNFVNFRIVRSGTPADASTIREWHLDGIDKGIFVTPPMSWQRPEELIGSIVTWFREHLSRYIWHEFANLPRKIMNLDWTSYPTEYWKAVEHEASKLVDNPTIFVANVPFDRSIVDWLYHPTLPRPDDVRVEHLHNRSDRGSGYLATVNGVDAFHSDLPNGRSVLISASMLHSVVYHPVATDALVTVELIEADDPTRSKIVVRFSQKAEWAPTPVMELILENVPFERQDE